MTTAALDVATGFVIVKCYKRHRAREFLDLLKQIDRLYEAVASGVRPRSPAVGRTGEKTHPLIVIRPVVTIPIPIRPTSRGPV